MVIESNGVLGNRTTAIGADSMEGSHDIVHTGSFTLQINCGYARTAIRELIPECTQKTTAVKE